VVLLLVVFVTVFGGGIPYSCIYLDG
jgi:hypothetical protein